MAAPPSPQVVGRYALHGKIAAGGMATVHFGRLLGAAGFARTVAVKRLHPHLSDEPEFLSTMIDEARLAARIHHPNVVPTLDVVAADGELLIVMEYVRGESLARLLRAESTRKRRVPLPIASAIVTGALHGLHAAHEATNDRGAPLEIVHRDVSPQNILVGIDGLSRVIDFGVAKAAGRLQTTREGVIKGKVAYMAPEQLTGRVVTRTVDVYAMGVVLWELLTGRRLFKGESEAALFGAALAGAKHPPSRHVPDLPEGVDELVMKALALDPTRRFSTAKDMAETWRRVVPPAFATDVGLWVEEVAREPLSRRGEVLAEIESQSDVVAVPLAPSATPREGTPAAPAGGPPGPDDAPTTASHPSTVSLGTSKPSIVSVRRSRRARLVGATIAGTLLVAGVAAFVVRAGAPSHDLEAAASIVTRPASVAAPIAPSSVPPVQASASATPSASSVAIAAARPLPVTTAVLATPGPPVKARAAPTLPPAPTASIRFSQPD